MAMMIIAMMMMMMRMMRIHLKIMGRAEGVGAGGDEGAK